MFGRTWFSTNQAILFFCLFYPYFPIPPTLLPLWTTSSTCLISIGLSCDSTSWLSICLKTGKKKIRWRVYFSRNFSPFLACLAFNNKAPVHGKHFFGLTASQQMRLKRIGISGQFDLNDQIHKKSQVPFRFLLKIVLFYPTDKPNQKNSHSSLSIAGNE